MPASVPGEGRSAPPASPGESKPDEIPSVAGLDARDGLSRVAGNRKLYVKLLRQFAEQQGLAVAEMDAALARGDVALAERVAHTLKGVAGNIGAKPVQSAAGALEKLLRESADAAAIEPAKRQLRAVLDPLLAELRAALEAKTSEPPAPVLAVGVDAASPAQSREAAAKLRQLLSEFDPGAADFIEANQPALRPLFAGDAWPQFQKLVEGYSFAEAQTQLDHALKELTSP